MVVRVKVKGDNIEIEEVGSVDKAKAKVCATMRSVEKIFKDSGFDHDIVCIRLVGDAKHVNDTFKATLKMHGKKIEREKYMNPFKHHLEGGINPYKYRALLICGV